MGCSFFARKVGLLGRLLYSRRLDEIRDFIDTGKVNPVLDRTFPLEDLSQAHEFVAGGHKRGGVAITVS